MTDSYLLEVVEVVDETADARSISFRVPEGAESAFEYKPGQFLTLAVPSDRDGLAARCYSLSSSPHDGGPLTVTVKRTVDGYASNWVCDHLEVGSTMRVLPPSGIFTPASLDADLLLFAGGSGVTPIMSITRTALAHGSGRVVVFYANRDERSVIFAEELTRLDKSSAYSLRIRSANLKGSKGHVEASRRALITGCMHVYHARCIKRAVDEGQRTCPVCGDDSHFAETIVQCVQLPSWDRPSYVD